MICFQKVSTVVPTRPAQFAKTVFAPLLKAEL
jgi:hypothetical protein